MAPDQRSANRATLPHVVPSPQPLSLRLGRLGSEALDDLARLRGISKAEAARQAIEEAADRERKRSGLAAEVRRVISDPGYAAETQEILDLMEELSDPG